jgi:SAM-dependent methyltransferase
MTKSLDLGSGPSPKNPFGADEVVGVDVASLGPAVIPCRLGFEPLPFEDSSYDYCSAFDLLEHIPRVGGMPPNYNPFIYLMNEIWRILKNNGRFYAQTPAYPYPTAFSDPTHVNYITSDTLRYFAVEITGDGQRVADSRIDLGQRYGFVGNFIALRNLSNQEYGHQIWLLEAQK